MTAGLRETWTTASGYRMFARVAEAGRGPAVVLVHGLGSSSRYMTPLASDLARDFRVYAPDLPGHGRSEMPRWALDVEELAHALAEWMRVAGLQRGIFVGNSMGCQVMAELAALVPESMSAAVLLGPTMDRTARFAFEHVLRLGIDMFREPLSLVALEAYEYMSNGPLRTYQTFRHALRHDMLDRVACITCPAVVVRGERDPIASRPWVVALAKRMPNARSQEIPGAAHALNYNAPAATSEIVRSLATESLR